MQCFDCATTNQVTTAVAVCSTCGAGLCVNHAVVGHADEANASVGNPSSARLPGRRIMCQTCSASGAADEGSVPAGTTVNVPGI